MDRIELLRVIDINGFGMYRPAEGLSLAQYIFSTCPEYIDYNMHPLPQEDYKIGYYVEDMDQYKFAFLDRNQYLRWIYDPQWRKDIDDLGGKLLIVEVDKKDCIIGNYQVLYKADKVISTKEIKATCFDNI